MKRIEVIKEKEKYNIDILDNKKYLAGTIIDLKRKQYYLILPDGYDDESVDFLIENIINKISVKEYDKSKNERVGEIKSYSDEILERELNELGLLHEENKISIENLGILSNKSNNNLNISRHA